jgi:site-specific DNA-methyltransferase (adenine-specific)
MIDCDYIECGDCLELMKELPDNSIDLIVTDPPYLMNYKTGRRKDKSHKFCTKIAGDSDEGLIKTYIAECYRIMKNDTAMYMFCNSNKVDFFKQELEKYFTIKNIIVWVKNNHTAGDLIAQFGKKYEFIFLVNKGRAPIRNGRITDVWEFAKVSGNNLLHQNQKPIELIQQCIEKHSDEGAIVFDGFMGSGTTAVACVNTNRHYIGYELDAEYFDIACKRLDEVENPDYIKPEILAYTE